MVSRVRFLRDESNPRWDDRQLHNWLDREVRFDATVDSRRVICRVTHGDLIHAFGPVPDEDAFGVVERHRPAIEAAVLEKIRRKAFATDIDWGDMNVTSIVLTGADIQKAITAQPAK